jgi:hypothetical protein
MSYCAPELRTSKALIYQLFSFGAKFLNCAPRGGLVPSHNRAAEVIVETGLHGVDGDAQSDAAFAK